MVFSDNGSVNSLMYFIFIFILFILSIYLIVLINQTFLECYNIIKCGRKLNIRLFIFLSMDLFFISKTTSFIIFLSDPAVDNAQPDTIFYIFDTWGVFFVLVCWSCISSYWIQVLYTYYVPHDFQLHKVYRVLSFSYGVTLIYFLYQISQTVLAQKQITSYETYGFIVYTVSIGIFTAVNGFLFLRVIKKSQSQSQITQKTIDSTVRKSKILIADLIISICLVIVQFAVFSLKKQVGLFLGNIVFSFAIEIFSLTLIMYVIGNESLLPYFFFNHIHNDLNSKNSSSNKNSTPMGSLNPSDSQINLNNSSLQVSVTIQDNDSNHNYLE